MKWLLTLNNTCVGRIEQEIEKLLGLTPTMNLYQHFPVMEIDVSQQQYDLISKIPCVIDTEQRITFKRHEKLSPSSWVLDSLDGKNLDTSYSFTRTGTGVHVYVVDSGIDANHREFGGRADMMALVNEPTADCTGHGSHVAGLIGGKNVGVAKNVTIHSIKVITCADDSDNFIIVNAFNKIISDVQSKGLKIAVVNLSLGPNAVNGQFPISPSLEAAIQSAFNANILTVVAAGNDNLNACSGTPSRLDYVVTVGAVDNNFAKAEFSNFGNCVKVFAAGTNSVSALANTTDQYTVKQGTSQAAPLVTGVLALIMQDNPTAKIQDVYKILTGQSLSGSVTNAQSDGNVLLQTYMPSNDLGGNISFDSIDYASLQGQFVVPLWAIVLLSIAGGLLLLLVLYKLVPIGKRRISAKQKDKQNRQLNSTSPKALQALHFNFVPNHHVTKRRSQSDIRNSRPAETKRRPNSEIYFKNQQPEFKARFTMQPHHQRPMPHPRNMAQIVQYHPEQHQVQRIVQPTPIPHQIKPQNTQSRGVIVLQQIHQQKAILQQQELNSQITHVDQPDPIVQTSELQHSQVTANIPVSVKIPSPVITDDNHSAPQAPPNSAAVQLQSANTPPNTAVPSSMEPVTQIPIHLEESEFFKALAATSKSDCERVSSPDKSHTASAEDANPNNEPGLLTDIEPLSPLMFDNFFEQK